MIHSKSSAGYIEAIQRVSDKLGYARAVDVSRELNITPWSTCTGLKLLEKKGMIEFDRNKFIVLTKEAKRDIKRFNIIKQKLTIEFTTMLNITSLNQAEAVAMEQVEEIYFLMNEEFMKAL